MTDIRQSPLYADYMKRIGWNIEKIGKWFAYIKKFPLIGSFIKIQRVKPSIPFTEIETLAKKYRAFRVIIELGIENYESAIKHKPPEEFGDAIHRSGWQQARTTYSPSKTIHIDLTPPENRIFRRFSEAKRRAVRRAVKNDIAVIKSADINEFISLKKKQDWLFGFLLKNDLRALWQSFHPQNAIIFFAYKQSNDSNHQTAPLAGILLLFWDRIAYYWQAAATKEGKKLFAPTLLVWEALKLAKKRGCKIFDFEGIYDERFPKVTKNWKGFTKFKEGFGGKVKYYLYPFKIT